MSSRGSLRNVPRPWHCVIEMTPSPEKTSRRTFLFRLGIAINAIAIGLFTIPIVGYVLSPARRFTWLDWIPLGPLTDYPEHQTRLAEYVNPFKKAWDGETAKIPCWVRRMEGDQFQVFAINCTHLVSRLLLEKKNNKHPTPLL